MFGDYLGLARSLLIYNSKPFRTRSLCRLYRPFVRPGDLAFDIGAHVGSHLRAFHRLGVRVVALEPQTLLFRYLSWVYGKRAGVVLLAEAVGREVSTQVMFASSRTPTVSSLSPVWMGEVRSNSSFRKVRWDREYPVTVTTLERLISRYGRPAFCKLDIEGSELAALEGLSTPLPALSVEFVPGALENTWGCLDRLEELGSYEYNWSRGERMRLEAPSWVGVQEIRRQLSSLGAGGYSGDIFARLRQESALASLGPVIGETGEIV